MITNAAMRSVNTSGDPVGDYRGLSTDTKPVENVQNGSTFLEMDTGDVYIFNADGHAWVKL